MTQEEKTRRDALKIIGGTVAGLAVGGAVGYLSRTPETITVPGAVQTVTATVTQTAQAATTAAQKPGYTFYLVSCETQEDEFFGKIYKGFMDACEIYGLNGKYVAPATPYDFTEQVHILENTVNANPDGIGLIITLPEAMTAPSKAAIAKGCPIIAVNSGDPRPIEERIPYLFYVGEISYDTGYEQATTFLKWFTAKFGRPPVRAMMANHGPGSPLMEDRWKGWQDAVKKAGTSAVDRLATTFDATKFSGDVRSYLLAHPDTEYVGTMFLQCGTWAYDVISGLGMADKCFVSAVDLTVKGIDYLNEGKVICTIDQQPYMEGYVAAEWLYLYKKYQFKPSVDILTGPYPVTADNVGPLVDLVKAGIR